MELQERLTKLSEASRRINEHLDFDSVLQDVVDSAHDLTNARYSGLTVLDEEGRFEAFVSAGLTEQERLGADRSAPERAVVPAS